MQDAEFAEVFNDISVDIALLQELEEARKALNVSGEAHANLFPSNNMEDARQ